MPNTAKRCVALTMTLLATLVCGPAYSSDDQFFTVDDGVNPVVRISGQSPLGVALYGPLGVWQPQTAALVYAGKEGGPYFGVGIQTGGGSATGAGSLTMTITGTGFVQFPGVWPFDVNGGFISVGADSSDISATVIAAYSLNDAVPGTTQICSFTGTSQVYGTNSMGTQKTVPLNCTGDVTISRPGPFSLTETLIIHTTGPLAGDYAEEALLAASVPEPATFGLMLMGFGIAGVGLMRPKRRMSPSV